jgi:hypothetical protein
MNKKFMILLIGIFMLSFVASAPPSDVFSNENGLKIFAPTFSAVKYNETFKLHLHVSDVATGVQLSNTEADCYLHLYSMDGSHLLEATLGKDGNGVDHDFTINSGNFTEHGETNAYYIWCINTAGDLGGELRGAYEVTGNGRPRPSGVVIIGFSVLLLFLLGGSVTFMLKCLGHLIERNFDLMDLGIMWGSYFSLMGSYQLATIYLGNVIVNEWLLLFVKIYAFPMVIVPVIALFLSLFRQHTNIKENNNKW